MPEQATRLIGRTNDVKAFHALEQATGRRVLAVDGMAGNGKSEFLGFLAEGRGPRDNPQVIVDLADRGTRISDHRLLDIIYQLVVRLGGEARPYKEEARRLDGEAHEILTRPGTVDVDVIARRRGSISRTRVEVHADRNRDLLGHRYRARDALLDLVVQQVQRLPSSDAVLMIDSFESVLYEEDIEFQQWFEHRLIPTLVNEWPALRIVIAGREKVPDCASGRRRTLQEWSDLDTETFLCNAGMHDSALRVAVWQSAGGHPLLTTMARQAWDEGNRSGVPLTPDDLIAYVQGQAARGWIFDQITSRLPKKLRQPVRVAALLQRLSLGALRAGLGDETSIDSDDYHRLLGMAFIQRRGDAPPRVHDLIRTAISKIMRDDDVHQFMAIHTRLAEYYNTHPDPHESLQGYLHHLIAIDPRVGMIEWEPAMDEARKGLDLAKQGQLLSLLKAPEHEAAIEQTIGVDLDYHRRSIVQQYLEIAYSLGYFYGHHRKGYGEGYSM